MIAGRYFFSLILFPPISTLPFLFYTKIPVVTQGRNEPIRSRNKTLTKRGKTRGTKLFLMVEKSAISFLYVSRVLGNNEFKSIDN